MRKAVKGSERQRKYSAKRQSERGNISNDRLFILLMLSYFSRLADSNRSSFMRKKYQFLANGCVRYVNCLECFMATTLITTR